MDIGRVRGRRQVLQLDDTNNETTFLARKENKMRIGTTTKDKPAGLSALGEYSDSDSNNSDDDESSVNQDNGVETSATTELTASVTTSVTSAASSVATTSSSVADTGVNGEVANFLSEVNSVSASNSPARAASLTPPPSANKQQNNRKKTNMYKSMFVKGKTEWNKKTGNVEEVSSTEIDELPEEPTTLWQICVDENTQFQYYWNTISNEVTWTIPSEYTQYLLQFKLYEEQLAKIPDDRREYLKKKKLGLLQSPKTTKPMNQPKPPTQSYNHQSDSSLDTANQVIPQPPTETPDGSVEQMTDPEKQFYSEIEELEKMEVEKEEETPKVSREGTPVKEVKDNISETPVIVEEPPPLNDVSINIDDIDNALEKALEKKKEELKKLEAEEQTASAVDKKSSNHRKRVKRQKSPDSSIYGATAGGSKKLKSSSRDWVDTEIVEEQPCVQTVDALCKVLVSYQHDEGETILKPRMEEEAEEEIQYDVESKREVLESKLEFLNVSKKGFNRLQIMLVELQTRYTDFVNGELRKDYFHHKLTTMEKHLESYEKRASPAGWTCQWDRTFRQYFYTNDNTGATQWEHPDASVQVIGETPSHRHRHSSGQSKSRSSKSSKRSKDKKREEKKSSKSKTSRRAEKDYPVSPEISRKSSKSHRKDKISIETIVENISLGGLLSKHRDIKSDSISISDDPVVDEPTFEPPPPPTVETKEPEDPPPLYAVTTEEEDEEEAAEDVAEEIPSVSDSINRSPSPTTLLVAMPTQQEVTTSTIESIPSSSFSQLSTTSAVSSSTVHSNTDAASAITMEELDGELMVSSSETKTDDQVAKETKKKKKDKAMANTNFALKKKNVSSLVNKWKKVKIEVEKEEKIDEQRQFAIRQKLEEWKKEH